MTYEAMHRSIRAVRILVDKPWNEVRSESNHKCLGTEKKCFLILIRKKQIFQRYVRELIIYLMHPRVVHNLH